jgi:hypothetical protein
MAVKTNQTWTLYKRNGCQDESNMNSHVWFVLTTICVVESSCLIRLDCHFFCREFMMAVKTNQTWTLYKTNGSQDESNMNSLHNKWLSRRFKHELSCLIRLDCHLFCREFMFDSSWLPFVLYRVHIWFALTTNGSQDESNMNCLQNKWQSRGFKHELSTQQMAVSPCLIRLDCHLCCREFTFDSPWLPFVL